MNTCTKFHRATFITLGDIPCSLNSGRVAASPAACPAVNLSETWQHHWRSEYECLQKQTGRSFAGAYVCLANYGPCNKSSSHLNQSSVMERSGSKGRIPCESSHEKLKNRQQAMGLFLQCRHFYYILFYAINITVLPIFIIIVCLFSSLFVYFHHCLSILITFCLFSSLFVYFHYKLLAYFHHCLPIFIPVLSFSSLFAYFRRCY
jgi:hypothetical protein